MFALSSQDGHHRGDTDQDGKHDEKRFVVGDDDRRKALSVAPQVMHRIDVEAGKKSSAPHRRRRWLQAAILQGLAGSLRSVRRPRSRREECCRPAGG